MHFLKLWYSQKDAWSTVCGWPRATNDPKAGFAPPQAVLQRQVREWGQEEVRGN
jgi:hypothetical protein